MLSLPAAIVDRGVDELLELVDHLTRRGDTCGSGRPGSDQPHQLQATDHTDTRPLLEA
jgi:hypothetical protein